MASSSYNHLPRLLHLLFPLLILSMLLPHISCVDNGNPKILQCNSFIVNDKGGVISEVKKAISFLVSSSSPSSHIRLKTIHGLAWCRPDISSTFCSSCLNIAAYNIQNKCAFNVVAARYLFFNLCYLRIDVRNFVGKLDTNFVRVWFTTKVEVVFKEEFWQTVSELLVSLKREIKRETTMFVESHRSFFPDKLRITGKALCSRDLDTGLCNKCLDQALNTIKIRCVYRTYCEVIYGSCFLTYRTTLVL